LGEKIAGIIPLALIGQTRAILNAARSSLDALVPIANRGSLPRTPKMLLGSVQNLSHI